MIRYIVIKTTIEMDKYHDPLRPWVIVSEEDGRVLPNTMVGRYPSRRAANREIRQLVKRRAGG